MRLLKKTLSHLGDGTVTRQSRNSRHCPEKELLKKKKKLEPTRQWNGHKKSEKQKAVPRKGDY